MQNKLSKITTVFGLAFINVLSIHSVFAETNSQTEYSNQTNQSSLRTFPNGIPDHQPDPGAFSIQSSVDVTPDPSIQVGPGVVVSPNVFVKGSPLPNPLLKDVLPKELPSSLPQK